MVIQTRWTSRIVTDDDAYIIAGWTYPDKRYGRLSIEELQSGWYRCALLDGELAGFICHGGTCRSPYLEGQYLQHPDDIDIGLGLRPDLTGKGLGLSLLEYALDMFGREKSARLSLFASNAAARRVYERAGFKLVCRVGEVLLMRREGWAWRDASRPLVNGMDVYPGDPPFTREMMATADDCGYNVTCVTMTAHNGTHIDAPYHIGLSGGVDRWPLELLSGAAEVVDLSRWRELAAGGNIHPAARRTLLKTNGSPLTVDEAKAFVSAGVKTLGVDILSVGAQGDDGLKTHQVLLGAGILILEGLSLDSFQPGWYELMCLPLSLPGCDGAPVRAMLRPIEHPPIE